MIKESENRKNLKLQMITFSWQRFIHMHKFDKFFKLSSGQKRCGPPKKLAKNTLIICDRVTNMNVFVSIKYRHLSLVVF